MTNEKTNFVSEVYLIETPNRTGKGLVVLSNGESFEVPVEVLALFNLPDFFLN